MSSSGPWMIRSGGEWLFGGSVVIACSGNIEHEGPGISDVAACRSRGFARLCGCDGDLTFGYYDLGRSGVPFGQITYLTLLEVIG